MKEFKSALRYGALSIKNEFCSVNLYLVFLFAFASIQFSSGGVSDYLARQKEQMHVFELYVFFLSTQRLQIVYLLGIMAISCGSLFYSGGAAYYLIRGNRRRWVLGQAVYLAVMTLSYNLFLWFSLCVSAGWHLTLSNEWSRNTLLVEQFQALLIGRSFDFPYGVTQMSPVSAGLITFLLSMLFGIAAGLGLLFFAMRGRGIFGAAVIAFIHYAEIVILDTPFLSMAEYVSPSGMSRIGRLLILSSNGIAAMVIYAVVFFCILIAVEFIALLQSAEKIDFIKLK